MNNLTNKKKRSRLIFYIAIVALPMLQFCIFYIGVNFNSILLAFKKYNIDTEKYSFVGFENFLDIFRDWQTDSIMKVALKNSLIAYCVTLICMIFSMFFSYYIFKKRTFAGFYKVILFLPNIISSLIIALIYMYFTERAVPVVFSSFGKTITGLLSNPKTAFSAVIAFNVLMSFGTQTLLISGAMEGISASVLDASKVDGCTPLQEFFHIIVPMIWPTITTFLVVGVAGIFTNQLCLYSFYGDRAEYSIMTIGYYLYRQTLIVGTEKFPYLAALGLILTAVVVPLTYLVKWGLNKIGPKMN